MLRTLRDAFKVKEIRQKLLYTFMMLVVVRLGSQIPVPGTDSSVISYMMANSGDAFNFFNAITGGSFENFSVYALSITPYITSSIIIQLLTIAIPKLEEIQKDGEEGRKKIAEITRYVTVGLALIQSIAMSIGFRSQGLFTNDAWYNVVVVTITLTAGSAMLMWIGEQITEKGVGNGISIVLLINILAGIPSDFATLYETFVAGKRIAPAISAAVLILAVFLAMIIFVVLLQNGVRKIPVQYSKRVQGRKMIGGQTTHIPLKVNTAGVIPVIFASTLMSIPALIESFFTISNKYVLAIFGILTTSNWCNPDVAWYYNIGFVLYLVLIVAFSYFYTSITFNTVEVSENMKKQGGFIPGIRPGKPTADYLTRILNYIVFIGAGCLMIVAVVPIVFAGLFGVGNLSFTGTSLIIIVGVVLETLKQIESQMVVRNYKGFLNT